MKRIYTIIIAVLLTATLCLPQQVKAQSPEKMSYQAVIRNSSEQLVTSQTIGMQISILQGSNTGSPVYVETQTPTTNANGLITIEIGTGITSNVFSAIDWADGPYFIKTETDPDGATGGIEYNITGTSQLLSVPYALHAKTAETVSGGITEIDPIYSIGDFAQGGIVFWVDETGQHGLVCAKADQGYAVRWYAGTYGNTQAKGNGPYSGEANTSIIIAAQVAIGDDENTYAARICNELLITEGGKTYGDWYLPSKEELNLMYQEKATIDSTATANSGSDFASAYYWSSTEYNADYAWLQNFVSGYQYNYFGKYHADCLRAIRAF